MVTWFYLIVFLLALIMAGSFLLQTKNADSMFVLFSILVVVNCLGRYMLAAAQSLEMAIWANKFLYVGGCFAPLLILRVCEIVQSEDTSLADRCADSISCIPS